MIFNWFCRSKSCKEFSKETLTRGYGMPCVDACSCKKIGPTINITEYPEDCNFLVEIIEYKKTLDKQNQM